MLNKLSSTYFILQGAGLYSRSIKKVEDGIQGTLKKVNELTGNVIAIIISKIYVVMTIGVFDTVSFWYHNHSCAMKTLSFLSMSCHLCDVERNDKDQSKPVVKHSNLSNIYGSLLPFHKFSKFKKPPNSSTKKVSFRISTQNPHGIKRCFSFH